jgi:hypothetical protein
VERAFLPLFSTFNSWLVAEADFLDARLLAAFVLCLPALFFVRRADGTLRGLIAFSAAAYIVWVWLYCIYRYVLPLEMLAPILCLAALLSFPIKPARAMTLAAAIAVAVTLTTGYPQALEPVRRAFGPHFVEVGGLPAMDSNTLLVMAGDHPAAFIVPSLPSQVRVIRINDWPFLGQSGQDGFEPLIRRTIANHAGAMLMLTHPEDLERARNIAMLFGLRLLNDCGTVSTNLVEDKFLMCKLQRWHAQ